MDMKDKRLIYWLYLKMFIDFNYKSELFVRNQYEYIILDTIAKNIIYIHCYLVLLRIFPDLCSVIYQLQMVLEDGIAHMMSSIVFDKNNKYINVIWLNDKKNNIAHVRSNIIGWNNVQCLLTIWNKNASIWIKS